MAKIKKEEQMIDQQNQTKVEKKSYGPVTFVAKQRVFVANAQIEAEQEFTVGPREAWWLRNNKFLQVVRGEIPESNKKDGSDLPEMEMRPGPAPEGMRLVKQG